MIERILDWAVPFVCGGCIAALMASIRMHKKADHALRNGVQCLLRSQIIAVHDRCTADGFCPLYGKESLKRLYDAYHMLGGNDVATALYEAVMELPLTQDHGKEG